LILTLAQHEKNLTLIIERLERISEKMEEISRQLAEAKKEYLRDSQRMVSSEYPQ